MAAGSHMTAEIWSLTLEIIRLLTGETYLDLKPGDHVTITVSPPPSLALDMHSVRKILEATRKITELLFGEMEIPLELCLEVKAENEEEPVTEKAGYLGVMGGDLWSDVKMEPSGVTPVRSPLGKYGDGSTARETGASSKVPCKEEESSRLIGAEALSFAASQMVAESHMTTEIWSLTLELICLLTGETYPDMKPGDHVTITVSPPPSLTPDRHTLQKILDVTRKITELLIREMESPQELCLKVKVENEEEAGSSGAMIGDLWTDVKMEPSEVTPVISQLGEYGDVSAAGETGASIEEVCKEEKSSHLIGAAKRCNLNITATILSHGEKDESTGAPTSPNPNPGQPPTELSFHLTTHSISDTVSPLHHTEQTSKKSYPCSECGKCFIYKSQLAVHIRIHTGEKPYSCPECCKCFTFKSQLTIHKRVHTGEGPHSCSECGKSFSCKSVLIDHKRVHTGEKPYSCSECGKSFSYKSALPRHMRLHTGEKPYSCFECGKSFSQKAFLNTHKIVHTGDKPFSCLECGKSFSHKSGLNKHKKVHTGEKPFSCSECGKVFSSKSSLIDHERVHTGEKPFSCSECGKCFSLKPGLNKHKRVHSGEKPYSCSECGKCFYRKACLDQHERVHTGERPFSCSECGKCFSQKAQLKSHKRVHTGEKPYSCSECGKTISSKSSLIDHKRLHTGEKPFSCSECGKCFSRKTCLNKHERVH